MFKLDKIWDKKVMGKEMPISLFTIEANIWITLEVSFIYQDKLHHWINDIFC